MAAGESVGQMSGRGAPWLCTCIVIVNRFHVIMCLSKYFEEDCVDYGIKQKIFYYWKHCSKLKTYIILY